MFVLSVHYKNTETAFREKLALQPEDIGRLQKSLQERGLEEAVYVSTCNRCELYGVGKYEAALLALAETAGVDPSRLRSNLLILEKEKAAAHVFNVASGMDSMVLGEDEILGQLRDAYEKAKDHGYTGYQLNTVFQAAFSAAKKVKTDTMLSKSSVSVATLAASACHRYKEGAKKVLLIGASGDTGRKVMLNLLSYGDCTITAAYRHHSRTATLEGVRAVPYEERYRWAGDADIVISATKSPHYTLTRDKMEENGVNPGGRLYVDLAVPRDIDECLGECPDTTLLTIDDFNEIAREHNEQKEKELVFAEEILRDGLDELEKDLLFHEYYANIQKLKEEQHTELLKFVYGYRKTARAEELRSFLQVLQRMQTENKI